MQKSLKVPEDFATIRSMENTGKVLFEDDQPQWYIALGERWVGPISASDVYQRILAGELTWAHFVWKAGQADWKRICDVATFQAAVPALPAKAVQQAVKEASRPTIVAASKKSAPPAPEERCWFLFYNDSQFGPFSSEEISRFLRVGKIHGRVHVWRDGMADWAKLDSIDRFADDVAEAKRVRELKKSAAAGGAPVPPRKGAPKAGPKTGPKSDQKNSAKADAEEKPQDLRSAPRRPLVAKILMANQEAVIVAVCRDISVGGMQVLTDRVPGEPGARIKLNVSPAGRGGKPGSGEGGGSRDAIEPFVAEGVIVRILEDGRGFSFRFDRLPESSRKAIEKYIEIAGS